MIDINRLADHAVGIANDLLVLGDLDKMVAAIESMRQAWWCERRESNEHLSRALGQQALAALTLLNKLQEQDQ